MNILCYGDSNTWGYRPGGAGRFAPDERYTGVLRRALGPSDVLFADGLCGRTAVFDDPFLPGRRGLDTIAPACRRASPGLLIVMLGTNDCKEIYGAGAAEIAAGVTEVAQRAREVSPSGLRVLLCSPVPLRREALLRPGSGYTARSLATSQELPAAYRDAARAAGFAFWETGRAAEADPADGEHMNASGHRAAGEAMARYLKELGWLAP